MIISNLLETNRNRERVPQKLTMYKLGIIAAILVFVLEFFRGFKIRLK